MHKSIFNEAHKSYYNDVDVEILNECRTIVPNGRFKNISEEIEVNERCSIDKRKAFTHAGGQIVKIPVFNEFDVWKPYDLKCDFRRLGDYTLYVVQACQGNIFFNKRYNLVYGIHLKKIVMRGVAIKILSYKMPSHIHKVKYKKAIDRLLETKISDDEIENNKIQKAILNIMWGLMEKGFNTKTVSRMFDNIKEALNHRDKYGGKIYVLDDVKMSCTKNGRS